MRTAQPVFICDSARTPIGRFGGVFKNLSALELGIRTLTHLVDKSGIPGELIDEVIVGQGYGTSEAPNIARALILDAGLPDSVCGYQVDRRCGSGLQAIIEGYMLIQSGQADLVIAGGTESMSQAPFYTTSARWGGHGEITLRDSLKYGRMYAGGQRRPLPGGMIQTAENLRREFAISRQEQDELALQSHLRATRAAAAGKFADEIVPIRVKDRLITEDEHPRADSTLEKLASLRPILSAEDPQATVTAGNSSGQNDAACFCILASARMVERLNLKPRAELLDWAVAGVPSDTMGIGPVPATRKVLARTGLRLHDMDLIELNEAFAAQVLACTRLLELGPDDAARLNVNGSGISLGHPIGATGARLVSSLTAELVRSGARYGLATLCIGGGQGLAAIIKNVNN
ncbi:acetyl-CoA C-acetyltransferase [Pseudomonas sp. B392_1p]|uniref:acetyl-CoA C-acetyltransferase n=1 Tax=Pseudomonas sp. B392_1p TaxID=3457507 RepID=UPI003FD0AE93